MNHWYSEKLYNDWYNSLTAEELEALAEYRRKEKEKSDRELRQSVMSLLNLGVAMANIYARRM